MDEGTPLAPAAAASTTTPSTISSSLDHNLIPTSHTLRHSDITWRASFALELYSVIREPEFQQVSCIAIRTLRVCILRVKLVECHGVKLCSFLSFKDGLWRLN